MKLCTKCGVKKPLTEFYQSGKKYMSMCKMCNINHAKERYRLRHDIVCRDFDKCECTYRIKNKDRDHCAYCESIENGATVKEARDNYAMSILEVNE